MYLGRVGVSSYYGPTDLIFRNLNRAPNGTMLNVVWFHVLNMSTKGLLANKFGNCQKS